MKLTENIFYGLDAEKPLKLPEGSLYIATDSLKVYTFKGDNTRGTVNPDPAPETPGWNLAGNSGTTAGTDFVGTADDQDVVVKRNNVEKVRVATAWTEVEELKMAAPNSAPATASSTGTAGEIRFTTGHIYFCTATDTWIRVALATW